jgi:hypothetical protein
MIITVMPRSRPDSNAVPEARELANHTRVISIAGPADIVTEELLSTYFSAGFVYQTDEIFWLVRGQAINIIEWRFGSYRCQAQWRIATSATTLYFLHAAFVSSSSTIRAIGIKRHCELCFFLFPRLLPVVGRHILVGMDRGRD